MMNSFRVYFYTALLVMIVSCLQAQELYTARGYWQELNKSEYKRLRAKKTDGDSLNTNEKLFLADHETFLTNYYQRMNDDERLKFSQLRDQWDLEALKKTIISQVHEPEFEWRARDRFNIGLYGLYYGVATVSLFEPNGPEALGIPLAMAGLWQLGPVIHPQKYDGISRTTMRASNTGKILGLVNGLSLGLLIAGDSDQTDEAMLALSTVGSIALGEAAFHWQKREKISAGQIELMRHYGFLGPGVMLLGAAATGTDNENAIGAFLLAGGAGGLFIGHRQAQRYGYSAGDIDAISSLTWISAGIGGAVAAQQLNNSASPELALVPATTAIIGTLWGQKMVRGVYLTERQGSTLNLACGGAALIGLGVMASAAPGSATPQFAVPSVLALVAQQLIFHKYKRNNQLNMRGGLGSGASHLSLHFTPENYWVGQRAEPRFIAAGKTLQVNSVFSIKLRF